MNNGIISVQNLKFISTPGQSTWILVEYLNQDTKRSFSKKIKISMRKCIRGEIISGISCLTCPEGFFSLSDDPNKTSTKECAICPSNAECNGGFEIFPNKGFWRKNENQTNMKNCLIAEACPGLGKYNGSKYFPLCSTGYRGDLCLLCENDYGKNSDSVCIHCKESNAQYVKFAFLTLFSLLLIVYQTSNVEKINVTSSQSRSLMKILVDHLSYSSIIISFKLDWNVISQGMFSVGDQFLTTVPKDMFNFDCFLTLAQAENKFNINFVLVSITPFLYIVPAYLLLIVYLKIKNYKSRKQNISAENVLNTFPNTTQDENTLNNNDKIGSQTTSPEQTKQDPYTKRSQIMIMMIIIFYNFFPRLMLNAVKILSCLNVDDGEQTFMESNIQVECWQGEHIGMVFYFFLLNILFWGIIVPLVITFLTSQMIKIENFTKNINIKKIIEFLTLDYKSRLYAWDLVVYFQ